MNKLMIDIYKPLKVPISFEDELILAITYSNRFIWTIWGEPSHYRPRIINLKKFYGKINNAKI